MNVGVTRTPYSPPTDPPSPTSKSTFTKAILPSEPGAAPLVFSMARFSKTGSIILQGPHVVEVKKAMTARCVRRMACMDEGFVHMWIGDTKEFEATGTAETGVGGIEGVGEEVANPPSRGWRDIEFIMGARASPSGEARKSEGRSWGDFERHNHEENYQEISVPLIWAGIDPPVRKPTQSAVNELQLNSVPRKKSFKNASGCQTEHYTPRMWYWNPAYQGVVPAAVGASQGTHFIRSVVLPHLSQIFIPCFLVNRGLSHWNDLQRLAMLRRQSTYSTRRLRPDRTYV
jgi:hypothetical protein